MNSKRLMPSHLASVILAALMPIKHNGKDYRAGQLLEVNEKDAVFLRMGGCVREPTTEELAAYEQKSYEAQRPPHAQTHNTLVTHEGVQQLQDHTEPEELPSDTTGPHADELTGTPVDVPEANAKQATDIEVGIDADAGNAISEEGSDDTGKTQSNDDKPVNPYDGWLKKDLNAELDKRGIEHDHSARNNELEALLIADDAKQAGQADDTAVTAGA